MLALGCTSKFLAIHYRVGKLEFLNSAYYHILSDCEGSLSSLIYMQERRSQFVIKLPVFKERNVHTYATYLCQFKCWEYCFQA